MSKVTVYGQHLQHLYNQHTIALA